ncbi:Threonine synthase [Piscirickettsia salmonis]|uniref:Threonine synthase n=1 Tax=Piscirickettsia salmonis TaxID=1238 RepID=A0A1L6TAZ0_PISSA|nr:threonine synthase [Piscirickettsia salmonis]AKP73538.1 threonine synthase [Piscirickettsia salmonis LF-89 = ATCC VR-1361]ALB22297.1 threonine synthase [Piscirickettsia salmonis]ALY02386.1 threonine synthase [Piscirickettsia salmonis]AMA41903.1 threonine synthase [Piscirickettsia salmonis]AOS34379.1 threonine synthase [Piscirickettsia salmonis]
MHYYSTRNTNIKVGLDYALTTGLATDGGLYVPAYFPVIDWKCLIGKSCHDIAVSLLSPFFKGSQLEAELALICDEALNFQIPLTDLSKNIQLLELFHGPTLSFKDIGARFLAASLNRLLFEKQQQHLILVATSGDTGSAVAAALHKQPQLKVAILFPEGKISARQQAQICCWGDNIQAIAVQGSFDDCQHLVKTAYENAEQFPLALSTSNSINIGRLLPQMTYYAYASLSYYQLHHKKMRVIVPSGNLGNVTAAFWAQQCGLPIEEIAIALNANQVVLDYIISGEFKPRASIATLANAMDVGKPSNFERLSYLLDYQAFKSIAVVSINDKEISRTIKQSFNDHQKLICPHTAVGVAMAKQLGGDWLVTATADPAKFECVLEPLLKIEVSVPKRLEDLLVREQSYIKIKPDLQALLQVVKSIE